MSVIAAFNQTPVTFRVAIAGSLMYLGSRYGADLPAAANAIAEAPQQVASAIAGSDDINNFGVTAQDFGVNWKSDEWRSKADAMAQKCLQHLPTVAPVAQKHGIPALLILAKHAREASCDFSRNALNGQPLNQRTTIVPANYGPFNNWAESFDAAVGRGYYKQADWSKASEWMRVAEEFNGLGYRNMGKVSPYVWSGDRRYTIGKYVADGQYDPDTVDQQVGVIPLVVAMMELTR